VVDKDLVLGVGVAQRGGLERLEVGQRAEVVSQGRWIKSGRRSRRLDDGGGCVARQPDLSVQVG